MSDNDYSDLLDSIESDERVPEERETSIHWTKADDRVTVYSAEPYVMRRLVQHADFRLDWYETTTETGTRSVDAEEYQSEGHDGRKPVYGVQGTLDISVVNIAPNASEHSSHARTISDMVLQDDYPE